MASKRLSSDSGGKCIVLLDNLHQRKGKLVQREFVGGKLAIISALRFVEMQCASGSSVLGFQMECNV